MTIKITIAQCLQAEQALQQLGAISFPVKLSWKIGRITEGVRKEIQGFVKAREAKIVAYNNPAEQGGFQVPVEKLAEFQNEVNELTDEEVEIWGSPILLSELGERDLPTVIFQNAGWLFSEEEEGRKIAHSLAEAATGAANG